MPQAIPMVAGMFTAEGIGTALVSGLAGAAASKMLAGKPPKPPPTVAMPDPEDQAKARKKALVEMMTRSGRASTMLTDQSQKLGG